MGNLRENLDPVYFFRRGGKHSDGRTPDMVQRTERQIWHASAWGLLSGDVDIDWVTKQPLRFRDGV